LGALSPGMCDSPYIFSLHQVHRVAVQDCGFWEIQLSSVSKPPGYIPCHTETYNKNILQVLRFI